MAASSHAPRPYHLTPAEETVMKAFWNSKKPLCQQDILDHVKENGDLFWKERSIFAIINSLMKKGCIKEDGMVRAGKTYARTFAPAMSRAEFYAGMVTNALTKKELVEFRRAMRQLANEDSESSDEEA
jgi:predicted transcriptional regulator